MVDIDIYKLNMTSGGDNNMRVKGTFTIIKCFKITVMLFNLSMLFSKCKVALVSVAIVAMSVACWLWFPIWDIKIRQA